MLKKALLRDSFFITHHTMVIPLSWAVSESTHQQHHTNDNQNDINGVGEDNVRMNEGTDAFRKGNRKIIRIIPFQFQTRPEDKFHPIEFQGKKSRSQHT